MKKETEITASLQYHSISFSTDPKTVKNIHYSGTLFPKEFVDLKLRMFDGKSEKPH